MNIESLKARIPWRVKLGAKLVLSRLPFKYDFWQRLNLFKHGYMEQPDYAYRAFRLHFDRSDFAGKQGEFVCLELGPGDTLFSCLIARAFGASATYLVDSGAYCRHELSLYRGMSDYLAQHGHDAPLRNDCQDIETLLRDCGGQYLTQGVDSLKQIPSASVDWIWSQAVLEHVRKQDFLLLMKELRRVLKPGGVCSHGVDLQDHLGGSLNNLRFREESWEADWMASSGFYTNRIRFDEMCHLFGEAGFAIDVLSMARWQRLPTPRRAMDEAFSSLPDDDLLVRSFEAILRPL